MPSNNFKLGEMLNKRSLNSKTWINFDGSYTTEIYQGVVHFEDYDGNLHNIDTDLFDEADLDAYDGPIELYGKEILEDAQERARVDKDKNTLNRDLYDYQGVRVPFKVKLPRNFRRGYKVGQGANELHFKPVNASPSMGYLDEGLKNKIHYQDVWNDSDVCLELNEKGVKETIVLKTSKAPTKFSFEVDGSLEEDLTSGNMKLEPAWLEDAEGTKRDVSQVIRREGEQTFIDLEADVSGLVYPILIDPTVILNPINNVTNYVYEGSPSANFQPSPTTNLFIGTDNLPYINRGLAKFDLSSFVGEISSAKFKAKLTDQYDTTNRNITVNRNTSDYTISTVSWNTKPLFTTTNNASKVIGNSLNIGVFFDWDITTIVQGWKNNAFPNYGLSIVNDESNPSTRKTFQNVTLEVTYNVPPSAPTVTAPNGGETWNSNHTITWGASSDAQYGESTVASGNFSLGGNGGKKIVKLDNGWQVTAYWDSGTASYRIMVLKPNQSWAQLCSVYPLNTSNDFCFESKGNKVYFLYNYNTSSLALNVIDATTQTNVDVYANRVIIENNTQSAMGNVSMAFNIAKTELHPTWTSKNATYPNSFNIRYMKITVDSAGVPTLGTVVQMTSFNISGVDIVEPSVVVRQDGNSLVFYAYKNGSSQNEIRVNVGGSGTVLKVIYGGVNAYVQSSPYALFVPQSINGLTNGRIEVVWHGKDATDSTYDNLRGSYSDDGGVTWSAMTKLTTGNTASKQYGSLTVNANNKVTVLYYHAPTSINKIEKVSNVWGSPKTIKSTGDNQFPNALVDLTSTDAEPTFIYKDIANSKIGYFGLLDSIISTYSILPQNGSIGYSPGMARLGQSFKMPASSVVRKIGILTYNSSGVVQNNTKLELVGIDPNSFLPNGTIYSSVSAPIPSQGSYNWVEATLPTPIFIPKDTLIGIQFTGSAINTVNIGLTTTNVDTNGRGYYDNTLITNVQDVCMKLDYDEITPQANLQYHIQLSTNNGGLWKDIVALTSAGATSYDYNFINEAESSLCKVRIRAYDGSAYGPYDESNGVFTLVHNQAPNSPTNLSPSGGAIDRAVINRISWTHSDPNGSDPQSKFDLQYRLQGAGSWTTVTQTTTNQYYDVPANTLSKGVIEYQVRTYDQAGLSGPYSSITTFNAVDKPGAPTITSPTNGATVPIAKPVIQWSAPIQSDYWVKVTDQTGNTVVWEEIKISSNKAVSVGVNLANGTNYKVQVAIKTATSEIWSSFAVNDITVSYTPPVKPTLTSYKDDKRGSITVNIQNSVPTGTQPNVTYSDLYRKEGNGEYILIAQFLPNNGSFVDYTIKPGESISYYVISYGDNGTFITSDVLSDSANIELTQLSLITDPLQVVTLTLGTKLSVNRKTERSLMQFAGRQFAVAEFGEKKENGFNYSYIIKTISELNMLESLLDSQETLLLRDKNGRKVFVTLENIDVTELATHWEIQLNPTQVDYKEGV